MQRIIGISALFGSVLAAQQPNAPHGVFEESPPVKQSPFSSRPIEFENLSSPITTSGPLTISKERLRHPPSKPARKEFERGLKAKSHRRVEEAIQHFSRAVELQPAFWEALTALADLYWHGGDPAGALLELDRAAAIDPDVESVQSNRAVALLALDRPPEAEQAAREALRLAPRSELAHYLVALAQVRSNHVTSETAKHFAAAVGKVPQAKAAYARVQEYLNSAPQPTTEYHLSNPIYTAWAE